LKNLIRIFLIISVIVFANVTPAFATDHTGDAVYRDGVFYGVTWHAAINDFMDINTGVIEAPGDPGVVRYDSWYGFLEQNTDTYQGPPQFKYGMTINDQNNVLNMARIFADKQRISYTLVDMLHYNQRGQTYVLSDDVTNLRCDGLVEYCYEWYNFPILTDYTGQWDISKTTSTMKHTSIMAGMNPVSQWNAMNPHR